MTRNRPWLFAVACLAMLVLILTLILTPWREEAVADIGAAIDWQNLDLVSSGREIYAAQCATCHGANMEGQPNWQVRDETGLLPAPPHDETGHTWHHPDALLFALTKYGPRAMAGGDYQSAMPAYEDALTDEQIVAVLAFIKYSWPAHVRDQQEQISQMYREQQND